MSLSDVPASFPQMEEDAVAQRASAAARLADALDVVRAAGFEISRQRLSVVASQVLKGDTVATPTGSHVVTGTTPWVELTFDSRGPWLLDEDTEVEIVRVDAQ